MGYSIIWQSNESASSSVAAPRRARTASSAPSSSRRSRRAARPSASTTASSGWPSATPTTGRWYLGVTMGRPTGHLTLGIGKAASATCTIIPEEFRSQRVSLSDICRIVEGTIIKRRALGRQHGVVLLSEALVERFDPAEVAELRDVDRDAQGNIRVAEIDLGRKVKNEVQVSLERRGIKATVVDKTIGYELGCAPPIPYDAEYARDLGYAAFKHLYGGGAGAVLTIQGGEFRAVPFDEVIDPATGRGRQRFVDVDTESYQVARDYMVRIGGEDIPADAGGA